MSDLSMEELQDELATLAAHIYAGTCRWLELVGEIDRRGSWGWGSGSCAQWLAWRCGLLPRTAREHVRVARRLRELPSVHAAFARGELSYAKVRALTRAAEPHSEADLLRLAQALTASQLERAVRAFRRVTAEDAQAHHERERLGVWWDDDGSLIVHGRLAPEDAALFVRALDAIRESLWERRGEENRGSAEPRPRPTNAEALAAMADAALTGATRSGGERHLVVVHAEADALSTGESGGCELDEPGAIAPETARRLACDASVVQISERRGKPVRVGRRTRTISPGLRRALQRRDRRCRFPGCENRLFVDAHHIRHWARGGETRLDNLVLLCRRHHRAVHEGGYAVDQRLRFYDPRGRPIPLVPAAARGDPDALVAVDRGPSTLRVAWPERMDLALTVSAMVGAAGWGAPP